MEGLELRKNIEIKFKHQGKEFNFVMRELSAGDIWGIKQTCIDQMTGTLDTAKMNALCLSYSIQQPSFTVETIQNLPPRVTDILLINFNKIHVFNPDEEVSEEKKTELDVK